MPAAAAMKQRKAKAPKYEAGRTKLGPKTLKDWKEEEETEKAVRRPGGEFRDLVDDAVGSDFRLVPYGPDRFRDKAGRKFQVSRFYPHQKFAFDFPMTQAQADLKKEALKALGMGYVYVLPQAPKKPDVLEGEIREALASCKKHSKP